MLHSYFDLPVKVFWGEECLSNLAEAAARYGSRALLITESAVERNDLTSRVQTILARRRISCLVFQVNMTNNTAASADEVLKLARVGRASMVIGLGGIFTLSFAKYVASMLPTGKLFEDSTPHQPPETPPLPYIEIPSTCRNPFMFQDKCYFADEMGRYVTIYNTQKEITKAVVIDPSLAQTISPKYTAAMMLETMLFAVEGLLSNSTNFFSDNLFSGAIDSISNTIKKAVDLPREIKFRALAAEAGFLTGLGLRIASTGIGTALSYALSGLYTLPRASVSSILLPGIIDFHSVSQTEKVANIINLIGDYFTPPRGAPKMQRRRSDLTLKQAADKTAEGIRKILSETGLPTRLQDMGLKFDDLYAAAESAHQLEIVRNLPIAVTEEDLFGILREVY